MRTIITGQKERIGDWVAEKIGCGREWRDYEAIGVESDGELTGGVVFDDYVANSRCSMHCAGTGNWVGREFLFALFDYAFRQLSCKVVVALVNSENIASAKFVSHLGFEEKCRLEGGSPEGDLIVFTMRKEECRWLERKSKEPQHG